MKSVTKSVFALFAALFILTAATSIQQEKKVRLDLTQFQVNVVYKALGKLPAEETEELREYIKTEYYKVFDTTKSK